MFYIDGMRTGGGGLTVAGAVAGDVVDTTGATLEGATDVGTVVTAAGVTMAMGQPLLAPCSPPPMGEQCITALPLQDAEPGFQAYTAATLDC